MPDRLVLNSKQQTIKLVNRKKTIRLKHEGKGDRGSTGYSTMVRQVHGSDPNVPRDPDALYVEWMGSVAPNNATAVDTWIVTP